MNGNLVVGAVIVILVVGAIAYLAWQKKRGINSCGCKDCGCCNSASNCEIQQDCCEKKQ